MLQQSRRGFLLGLLAAPVIVKASSLMPVKVQPRRFTMIETPEIVAVNTPSWPEEYTKGLFEALMRLPPERQATVVYNAATTGAI